VNLRDVAIPSNLMRLDLDPSFRQWKWVTLRLFWVVFC
jgi:hypothetical protein